MSGTNQRPFDRNTEHARLCQKIIADLSLSVSLAALAEGKKGAVTREEEARVSGWYIYHLNQIVDAASRFIPTDKIMGGLAIVEHATMGKFFEQQLMQVRTGRMDCGDETQGRTD